MEHTIRLIELHLTDGSRAYDVLIGEARFPCCSFADAADFVDKFRYAVGVHTNETTRLLETEEAA